MRFFTSCFLVLFALSVFSFSVCNDDLEKAVREAIEEYLLVMNKDLEFMMEGLSARCPISYELTDLRFKLLGLELGKPEGTKLLGSYTFGLRLKDSVKVSEKDCSNDALLNSSNEIEIQVLTDEDGKLKQVAFWHENEEGGDIGEVIYPL